VEAQGSRSEKFYHCCTSGDPRLAGFTHVCIGGSRCGGSDHRPGQCPLVIEQATDGTYDRAGSSCHECVRGLDRQRVLFSGARVRNRGDTLLSWKTELVEFTSKLTV